MMGNWANTLSDSNDVCGHGVKECKYGRQNQEKKNTMQLCIFKERTSERPAPCINITHAKTDMVSIV